MIIAISGKQGSGKSRLAERLHMHLPRSTIRKFAQPIYEMHDAVNAVYNSYGVETPKKDGLLLQWLGTEHGRGKDPNIWTSIMARHLPPEQDETLIIDDIRFEDEFDLLAEAGALMVRLECSETVRKARCPFWRDDTKHPSEVGLDEYVKASKFDLVLHTSGELHVNVYTVLQQLS